MEPEGAKRYEMLWDCDHCGARKLLAKSFRFCPNCGKPQNPNGRYFPSDEDKVEVKNYTYIGPDIVCVECGMPNAANSRNCVSCGKSLEVVLPIVGLRTEEFFAGEKRRRDEVFISYSRSNKAFVEKVVKGLKVKDIDPWFDKDDIPTGANWWNEIRKGIVRSNYFIFITSEESLQSEVCNWELDYAIYYNKLIIPLLLDDVFKNAQLLKTIKKLSWKNPDGKDVVARKNWNHIQSINFIPMDTQSFASGIEQIARLTRTDFDYVEMHTRLLERAKEWKEKEKINEYLLRGKQLDEAERWLENPENKKPAPVHLHVEYLLASRKSAAQNIKLNQNNLSRSVSTPKRIGRLGIYIAVIFIIISILSVLFFIASIILK